MDIPYGLGQWPEDGYGSQRAVVQVDQALQAVSAALPWRRRDAAPENKDIRVYDAAGARIYNVVRGTVTRARGEIVFEPSSGPGEYFIYFLPCSGPRLFEDSLYFPWQDTADPAWLASLGEGGAHPQARLLRFEARSEFDRRDPMELIADEDEIAGLLARCPQAGVLIFPEDRRFPARMSADLPYRWVQRGPAEHFEGQAHPGEFYPFQIGIYACRAAIAQVTLQVSELRGPGEARIAPDAIRCLNLEGLDWEGRPFIKNTRVEAGQVQALWVVVRTPEDLPPGAYRGELALTFQPVSGPPLPPARVTLALNISGEPLPEHGCLEDWRLSRLAWLDSQKGREDEIIPPYLPLELEGDTIRLLARALRFDAWGFPESLVSNGQELLAGPLTFTVESIAFTPGGQPVTRPGKARAWREWQHAGDGMEMRVLAQVDFDGCLEYRVTLRALRPLHTGPITLSLPLDSRQTRYFMGLGVRGGKAPERVDWRWEVDRITNMLWTGTTQAGLHLNLMHAQDLWPQAYTYRPWGTPTSWDHAGSGRCSFWREEQVTHIQASAGPRDWQAGEVEEFRFRLLITPFKPLDPQQWDYRYSDKTALHLLDPEDGPARGITIAHLHHGAEGINPWINYPFLTLEAIQDFRQRMLRCGYRDVDVYYTLREISSHISELWAMRSLGDEIFVGGAPTQAAQQEVQIYRSGGGYAWLQEHLVEGYARAWLHVYPDGQVDAAIATQGLSRLHNFFVEGMDLLMKATGCGGLYIDGLAFGRSILQRVARVMAANRSDYRIKFHSGNNYDFSDWRCSVLCQYAEHLPYITDLWIGEMFDYNQPPDYWLVEMSGIPFGLTSEMLDYEHGGNPWRGMLYGMDGRMHPSAPGLWKLWDAFGIQQAAMHGYWQPDCPVQTGREDVLATVYTRPGKALVALGSWSSETVRVKLAIDWAALGIQPQGAALLAPEIPSFQPPARFAPGEEIPVEAGRGWLLVLE